MHTLYGSPGSGSAAIEVALQMTGLPWRAVRAATWEPDSALAELRQHNPLGQIPTLCLPDGSVLTESAAILIHLGLAVPGSGLLPSDPAPRAQALRGLVFISANCYAAIGLIDYPERWCAPATVDQAAVLDSLRRGSRARLHSLWEQFADQFVGRPFLSGAQLGALDILAAVVSRWSGARAHLQAQRPAFFATLKRIEAEPVVARVFAQHWPDAGTAGTTP
jgi:GST-like protein